MRRALLTLLIGTGCSGAPAQPAPAPSPVETAAKPPAAPAASTTPAVASAAPPEPVAEKPLTRPKEPLNVLLILVDSMRADMPWAGYERKIAPNLTKLESESVSYTRGYSVSSYTAKSVAAALSGQYPSTLRRSGYFFTKYSPNNLFLAEVLQKSGTYNMSGHAHMYMKPGNGMDQGFDVWKVVPGISFDSKTDKHITSQKLTPMAVEMLNAVPKDKQFFMYLHYMDPHDVYVKHKESPNFGGGKRARDRYDQEMFYTDIHIGKLLDHCRAQPWWSKTAVIVSADHGEAFGEHKVYRHAFEVWDVLTHVPLFFHVPGAPAMRLDTPRSHIDLAPTILDLMGKQPAPAEFAGKTMVPELFGKQPPPRPVLLDLPADSNNPRRRAVIQGDYKLLVFDNGWRKDLYNLKTDPGEKTKLNKTEQDKLKEMTELFEAEWGKLKEVAPYGGNKLKDGKRANGPT